MHEEADEASNPLGRNTPGAASARSLTTALARSALRALYGVLLGACLALGLVSVSMAAGEPLTRVLIINSFSGANAGYDIFTSDFRSELAQDNATPIAFFEVSLDGARFDPAADTEAYVRFLRDRFADRPLDLVVLVGPPATSFYAQNRARLFPTVPMLIGAAEQRIMRAVPLGPSDGSSTMSLDLKRVFAHIMEVLPDTKRIVVVIGDSPFERFWVATVREEEKSYAIGAKLEIWNELSLQAVEQRAASLPPDSAILFAEMYVDGAGVSRHQDHVLARLHALANAPIFGLFTSQLGKGIVGGPLLSEQVVATRVAKVAHAILSGEVGAALHSPVVELATPEYDWRELQRWRIPERRLPAGSKVDFREPSLWQQYKWTVVATLAVLLLQSALLAGLLLQRAHRRRAEREALSLSGRILTAHEDERRHLARELHDDITPRLARLAIDVARTTPGNAVAGDALSIQSELARLSEDVHGFSYRLHPTVLDDLGLPDALRAECDRIASGQQLDVALNVEGVPDKLPGDVALCTYRIAQEALRNIARHAHAKTVRVSMLTKDGGLQLSVVDDGVGFDASAPRARVGLGHASMRERVRQLGGRLQVRSLAGQGTSIVAWVPFAGVPA
ncbi:MAG: sensor histidine kinase [Burkholderiales bacterium]